MTKNCVPTPWSVVEACESALTEAFRVAIEALPDTPDGPCPGLRSTCGSESLHVVSPGFCHRDLAQFYADNKGHAWWERYDVDCDPYSPEDSDVAWLECPDCRSRYKINSSVSWAYSVPEP